MIKLKYHKKINLDNLVEQVSFKLPTTHHSLQTNKGFSVIELIMVVTIMTLITSVVLYNHARFSGGVLLENLAYEIALTVRQAQFFGINVRENLNVQGDFSSGYGVFFDKTTVPPNSSFIFFSDTNNDGKYNSGSGELLEQYNMAGGNIIEKICVDNDCSVEKLYITFKRPNPDAIIKTGGVVNCGVGCGTAQIYIGEPRGKSPDKIITVRSTGQISISTDN